MDNHAFILFEVAGTTYGIPSRDVQQMELIDHITPLPNAPPYVDGVVFTRGQVIPAVNLRMRFGFERTPATRRTRLIVISRRSRTIGLIVDSAREFMSIPGDAIRPPHEAISNLSGSYLEGIAAIGDRIILILKVEELVGFAKVEAASGRN
jgi:purine-binding chemotaxis protein CheW